MDRSTRYSIQAVGRIGLGAAICALAASAAMTPPTSDFSDGRIVSRFTFGCTTVKAFQPAVLGPAIADAMKRHRDDGVAVWGDRAFRFDLNTDGRTEYFVPLSCGATGNCSWAVVSGSPPKVIGEFTAEAIFVHAHNEANPWSTLTIYERSGLPDGSVSQYTLDPATGEYSLLWTEDLHGIVTEAFKAGIGWPTCEK